MSNLDNYLNDLVICKLTPDKLNDYLYFFENVAHTDNKEWDRCYCVNYCSDHNRELAVDLFDADVRRTYAIKYVNEGKLQGYLAYHDGKLVGWCNANDKKDCLGCFGCQLICGNTKPTLDNLKIKSVFCFTVAPAMRGKHIATALLERVIKDAQEDGYDYIEAYPDKNATNMYYNFVGPIGLYQKYGFTEVGTTESHLIYRKKL